MDDPTRRLRLWMEALSTRTIPAITGPWWEQSASTAEEPERVTWDRARADGTLHMPWVEIHATPCPGVPWTTTPDRWNGSLNCRLKHWHSRASLGVAAPAGAS